MGWLDWKRRRVRAEVNEGFALLHDGQLEQAQRTFEAYRKRDPANARVLEGLAEIALKTKQADLYVRWTNELLQLREALAPAKRVTICHRQADVCLGQLNSPQRAAEALARIELDYPGSADATRARRRIEQILAHAGDKDDPEN